MNLDTFCTRKYKGGFIHTCYDRDLKKEVVRWQMPNEVPHDVKSYRAAQLAITQAIRKEGNGPCLCNRRKFDTLQQANAYAERLRARTGIFHAIERAK